MNDDIVSLLDAVHESLFGAVTGLTDEQFRRRPGTGEWSIVEVLAHLAGERRRLRATLVNAASTEPYASGRASDEERTRQAREGRRQPPPQVIHDLIGSHRAIHGAIDKELSSETEIPVPVRVSRSVTWTSIESLVYHEIEHLSQIWEIRRQVSESIALIPQDRLPEASSRTISADNSFSL